MVECYDGELSNACAGQASVCGLVALVGVAPRERRSLRMGFRDGLARGAMGKWESTAAWGVRRSSDMGRDNNPSTGGNECFFVQIY